MLCSVLHLVLHVLAPAPVARLGWRTAFWRAWAVMVATMLVDLDHLLADPIYDPNRCSLTRHPLHSVPACAVYLVLLAPARTRLVAAGLAIHMALDGLDCWWQTLC